MVSWRSCYSVYFGYNVPKKFAYVSVGVPTNPRTDAISTVFSKLSQKCPNGLKSGSKAPKRVLSVFLRSFCSLSVCVPKEARSWVISFWSAEVSDFEAKNPGPNRWSNRILQEMLGWKTPLKN